ADIDTPLVLVVILKGATVFAADLLRSLSIPAELEFVSAASYGSGTTPGKLKLAHMVEGPLVGRHVLLIEVIIDSGRTVGPLARARRPLPQAGEGYFKSVLRSRREAIRTPRKPSPIR